MSNRAIAERFAKQFTPKLSVVRTERINGQLVPDAYCVAYWDADRKIGITAHAVRGQLKAYIEAAGPGDIAEQAGRVMATALGMFKANGAAT